MCTRGTRSPALSSHPSSVNLACGLKHLGAILAGEVLKVSAEIHTHVKLGERVPLGNIPNILFHPWVPVDDDEPVALGAAEELVKLQFIELFPNGPLYKNRRTLVQVGIGFGLFLRS